MGFRVKGPRFRVQGKPSSEVRVEGLEPRVQGTPSSEVRVKGPTFAV